MLNMECAAWAVITICGLSWIVYALSHFRVEKWEGPYIDVPRYSSVDAHIKAEKNRWKYGK